MSPQTTKIYVVLFLVFSFGVLFGMFLKDVGYVPSSSTTAAVSGIIEEQKEIVIDLTIDYGNGDIQSFPEEQLSQRESVFDLLMTLEDKGIVIEVRNFPGLGKFVEAIHGVRNSNNFYWQYWVNDDYAKVGAGQYILQDGDKVIWKRTDQQE